MNGMANSSESAQAMTINLLNNTNFIKTKKLIWWFMWADKFESMNSLLW